MDPLSSRFFLFLIVFIALSTAGLNKRIRSFSFSLHFSVVIPLPSVESILTTKQLNERLINVMELSLATDFVFNSAPVTYREIRRDMKVSN